MHLKGTEFYFVDESKKITFLRRGDKLRQENQSAGRARLGITRFAYRITASLCFSHASPIGGSPRVLSNAVSSG